jgi:hypothetical protein
MEHVNNKRFIYKKITPHYTTSHHITPHHTTPHHNTPNHTTPHHTTPHHTKSHHTTPHHTTPHHTKSHHNTPQHNIYHINFNTKCVLCEISTHVTEHLSKCDFILVVPLLPTHGWCRGFFFIRSLLWTHTHPVWICHRRGLYLDATQHSQGINIHASCGIRIRNPRKRAATHSHVGVRDLRHRLAVKWRTQPVMSLLQRT